MWRSCDIRLPRSEVDRRRIGRGKIKVTARLGGEKRGQLLSRREREAQALEKTRRCRREKRNSTHRGRSCTARRKESGSRLCSSRSIAVFFVPVTHTHTRSHHLRDPRRLSQGAQKTKGAEKEGGLATRVPRWVPRPKIPK